MLGALALGCLAGLPAGGAPLCAQCVAAAPANVQILESFTFRGDELPSPSFAVDGVDRETVWLASDPQFGSQRVARIAGGRRLIVAVRDLPISGNVASGKDVAAAVPFYDRVSVWSGAASAAKVYDVPSNDNVGTLAAPDQANVDAGGTLWIYRQRDDLRGGPSLYVLRRGDARFAQVTLPAKSWAGLDCRDAMRVHEAGVDYAVDTGTLQLRKTGGVTCSWSSDPSGVTHLRADGTSKPLRLVDPASLGSGALFPLPFSVGAHGDIWVWTGRMLCNVGSDESAACARLQAHATETFAVAVAGDGTLWFRTAAQTLVHARFVRGP